MNKDCNHNNTGYVNHDFEENEGSVNVNTTTPPPVTFGQTNATCEDANIGGATGTTELDNQIGTRTILKNVIIISVAFMFLFTSYNSMSNLQSSINKQLGTVSLAVVYSSLILSCSFLPSLLINKLKEKNTMVISMLGYSSYIAAQFYPRYYTLVPTAMLVGLGAAPMWSAKCTYLTVIGKKYAGIVGERTDVIITRFFGIFFFFFQSTQVLGNLISSTILASESVEIDPEDPVLATCGRHFFIGKDEVDSHDLISEESPQTKNDAVSTTELYTMSSIYLISALLSSLIIFVFVDPLDKYKDQESCEECSSSKLLVATFTQLGNPYQLLIIPLTFWSGIEQAFIGADFTAAFVSCGYGVHMVGFVMIVYGVCDATFSICSSYLVKIFGRIFLFTFGFVINMILIIVMLTWAPSPNQPVVFFMIAGLWGISDAIWQAQINGLYGVIFPGKSEAAFSNYRLWESLGFIVVYVCSTLLGVEVKLYMLIIVLVVGMMGFYTIEIIESRKKGQNTKL